MTKATPFRAQAWSLIGAKITDVFITEPPAYLYIKLSGGRALQIPMGTHLQLFNEHGNCFWTNDLALRPCPLAKVLEQE